MDTQWFSIDAIPKDAKKLEKNQFLAASEKSGHAHGLFGKYEMYEHDGGFIIDAKEDCVLNHCSNTVTLEEMGESKEVPYKDHKPSYIKAGLYYVGIQTRFDARTAHWERVKD